MSDRLKRALAGLAGLAIASCARTQPAARDQVVVTIDTDAPVPSWVDRLHVEVFDASGVTPLDARDYAMPDPKDWPLSFGVRAAASGPSDFRLRVRAYDSTRNLSIWAQSTEGEPSHVLAPDAFDPVSTIDRVVRVSVSPGAGVAHARVTLRGDCFGVASDVAAGRTCVDAPAQMVDAPIESTETAADSAPSLVGTWTAAQPTACELSPRAESGAYDQELCIPGGVYIMGDRRTDHLIEGADNVLPTLERVVEVTPFLFDRYEVSVARFRAAVNDPVHPFVPPKEPTLNGGGGPPCSTTVNLRFCSWRGSSPPADAEADALPLTCVTAETARAFCQWAGGDLPSEAQWEYAASQAFRDIKSDFAWVGAGTSCDIAAYGRYLATTETAECGREVACGPLRVDVPFGGGLPAPDCVGTACVRDETPGPAGVGGIIGLSGNVAEWVRDANIPYSADCWLNAPRIDPVCENVPGVTAHTFRGGSWIMAAWMLATTMRSGGFTESPLIAQFGGVGFRCVRPGKAAP